MSATPFGGASAARQMLAVAVFVAVWAAALALPAKCEESAEETRDALFKERMEHAAGQLDTGNDLLAKLEAATAASQSQQASSGNPSGTFTVEAEKTQPNSEAAPSVQAPAPLTGEAAVEYGKAIRASHEQMETARKQFGQAIQAFNESKAQEKQQPKWAAKLRGDALRELGEAEKAIEQAGTNMSTADTLTGGRFKTVFAAPRPSTTRRSSDANFSCHDACKLLQQMTGVKIGGPDGQQLTQPRVNLLDGNTNWPDPAREGGELTPRRDPTLQNPRQGAAVAGSRPAAGSAGLSDAPVPKPAVAIQRSGGNTSPPGLFARSTSNGTEIQHYDANTGLAVLKNGQVVNVAALQRAVQLAAPAAAKAPLFKPVPDPATNTAVYRLDPAVRNMMGQTSMRAQIEKVGGVALDVTLEALNIAGVPDFRVPGNAITIDDPIMVSLAELYRQVEPYARGNWTALPDHLRYPAGLGRVRGFVLSPDREDVFLVGTPAANPLDRIDIDTLSIALASVWKKGLVPAVSLDPLPDNIGGPQYPRVMNIPRDSVAAKIMLDADYEMKAIMFGLRRLDHPSFRAAPALMAERQDYTENSSRFWFYPTPLQPDTIHVSETRGTVLFESELEVLTEEVLLHKASAVGTGTTHAISRRLAESFTAALPNFEASDLPQPVGIYRRLHGVTDVVTVAKLLRLMRVDYPILNSFSALPYRALTGAEAVPAFYKGLVVPIGAPGRAGLLSGGIDMRSRANLRAFDAYQDVVVTTLERAAAQDRPQGQFATKVSLSFALPRQDSQPDAALQRIAVTAASSFDGGDYAAAARAYGELTELQPFDADAWVGLARSESFLGRHDAAQRAIDRAQILDPTDAAIPVAALDVARRADPNIDLTAWDPALVKNLSDDYVGRAYAAMHGSRPADARRFADEALALWQQNGDAHLVRFWLAKKKDAQDARFEIISAIRLNRQQLRQPDHANNAKPRLAFALSLSALHRVDRIRARMESATIVDGKYLMEMRSVLDELRRAAEEAEEAFKLDPSLALAMCTEVMVRAVRLGVMREQSEFTRSGIPLYSPDAARKLADEAIERFPDVTMSYEARAILFDALGNFAEADRDLTKAISLDPTLGQAFAQRAFVRKNLGDCRAARDDLQRAKMLRVVVLQAQEQEIMQCR